MPPGSASGESMAMIERALGWYGGCGPCAVGGARRVDSRRPDRHDQSGPAKSWKLPPRATFRQRRHRGRRVLGWTARLGLDEILASAWAWHSTHLDGYAD